MRYLAVFFALSIVLCGIAALVGGILQSNKMISVLPSGIFVAAESVSAAGTLLFILFARRKAEHSRGAV